LNFAIGTTMAKSVSERRTGPMTGVRVAMAALLALAAGLVATGCRQQMADQPTYRTLKPGPFFEDGRSVRQLPEGTVFRGGLREDEALYTGKIGKDFVDTFPFPMTSEVLRRGQERFNIFCTPCHDRAGTGSGMVVLRGYPKPPSFHIDRLRQAKVGYLYDVITQGFGRMPTYAPQIPPRDRWAIVGYLRALQYSQQAPVADVPAAELGKLESGGQRP
jgi:hypothetical protein